MDLQEAEAFIAKKNARKLPYCVFIFGYLLRIMDLSPVGAYRRTIRICVRTVCL